MDTRVVVTKFLGVHLDFQLNWSKHLSGITNKIANHVSVMYRVRPFTVQIVHSFCRQACLPYLNYCCEAWGITTFVVMSRQVRLWYYAHATIPTDDAYVYFFNTSVVTQR